MRRLRISLIAMVGVIAGTGIALAQPGPPGQQEPQQFGIVGAFEQQNEDEPVSLSSQFTAARADRPAMLMISAKIV
ncbi:MAG: hypothetical protein L0Z07_05885, partial [Planctomycetes bacterium]|nr:hypothetical protein [Planctomycetota bacterium]